MRFGSRIFLFAGVLFPALLSLASASPAKADDKTVQTVAAKDPKNIEDFDQLGPFPVEPGLKKRVRFWIDVYSKYSKYDMVMHDANYPHLVFDVVPTRAIRENRSLSYAQKQAEVKRVTDRAKNEIAAIFRKLHENQAGIVNGSVRLNEKELKIFRLYGEVTEKDKFLNVLKGNRRIRGQFGLKESFLEGLFESGRYLPGMKHIALNLGLPSEIAYLPFLESGFDRRALSKVGASGLWQFMPGTGKFFLRVDDVVDERNDPMKAAEGAALLMRDNYQALEEWPLAITAYNHGRAGMARAVKVAKTTSLAKIIATYDGPNFGFASANFYSAFLAALHVAQNAKHYFGEVDRAEPLVFDEFVMPEYMEFGVLAKNVGIEPDVLKEYNPGLTRAVFDGKKRIPVGYTLRIPFDRREDFLTRYRSIPEEFRFSKQVDDPNAAKAPAAKEEEL